MNNENQDTKRSLKSRKNKNKAEALVEKYP